MVLVAAAASRCRSISEIVAASRRPRGCRSVLTEVKQFEQRQAQLQQRVALIQQLRRGQSVPVQLLDHVSRSLPDTLWLTSSRRAGASVTIEGRSTTLIALSDFVGNLGTNPLLKKPIEIVNSQVEPAAEARSRPADVISVHREGDPGRSGDPSTAAGVRR